jgi:hypothetical protein
MSTNIRRTVYPESIAYKRQVCHLKFNNADIFAQPCPNTLIMLVVKVIFCCYKNDSSFSVSVSEPAACAAESDELSKRANSNRGHLSNYVACKVLECLRPIERNYRLWQAVWLILLAKPKVASPPHHGQTAVLLTLGTPQHRAVICTPSAIRWLPCRIRRSRT